MLQHLEQVWSLEQVLKPAHAVNMLHLCFQCFQLLDFSVPVPTLLLLSIQRQLLLQSAHFCSDPLQPARDLRLLACVQHLGLDSCLLCSLLEFGLAHLELDRVCYEGGLVVLDCMGRAHGLEGLLVFEVVVAAFASEDLRVLRVLTHLDLSLVEL
jgi:hypothetical protein